MTRTKKMDVAVPSVCVFDVNETLLDIEFMTPLFQSYLVIGKLCASGMGNSSSIRTL